MTAHQANLASSRPFAATMSIPTGPSAPAGTFLPGTKVQVGSHRVIVDKYLSEGGFAHVYVVTLPRPVDGKDKAVLKRVAVPDKEHLQEMRTEVETMKRLRGHKQIVKYIDSHASSLKNGGYEVFLLMEWCDGGGLIDFMNTRLQNRLTEPEILKIFTDVAEGVACMHYLKPALMHRDIKVENVLITTDVKSRIFKLCDFGSSAVARPAPTSAAEARLVEDDIQRHTTLQYRSPEMIDVYRKHPIDEKADIWALGCFLYKLCYYTTPFEELGQMAILNARFKYPGYPKFSDDLKLLIASMLQEQPARRPNIYQVLAKASKMDARPLTIKDIYSNRSQSEDTRPQPQSQPQSTPTKPESKTGATLAPPHRDPPQALPQVEPMRRGRPSKPMSHHASARPSPSPLRMVDHSDAFANLDGGTATDELSSKFPKLDDFSLINDRSSKFAFSPPTNDKPANDLAQRVTEALADDAFVRPASPPKPLPKPRPSSSIQSTTQRDKPVYTSSINSSTASRSNMISTAVGSSPPLTGWDRPPVSNKPIWRVPDGSDTANRSASITQASSRTKPIIAKDKAGSRLANLLQEDAARSQTGGEEGQRVLESSRPSLEGGRPALKDLDLDSSVQRSKSLSHRARPVSVNVGSRATHINDRQLRKEPELPVLEDNFSPSEQAVSDSRNIVSDIEYLRAREEEEKERHKHMKRSSDSRRHQKRSSLPSAAMAVPSAAISSTKSLLHGRFGDAFRKFESHGGNSSHDDLLQAPPDEQHILSPIAGSVATDLSDDRRGLDETEELSPELRRELEKQKLEAEERRVERAAAEYKARMAGKSANPPPISTKAAAIQNRVQSLLNQNERPSSKTATGYGRFTEDTSQGPYQQEQKPISAPASSLDLQAQSRSSRPLAPPKPQILRTGTNDLTTIQTEPERALPDDWEDNFSKRYPSLSQFDTPDSATDRPRQLRMKEV